MKDEMPKGSPIKKFLVKVGRFAAFLFGWLPCIN